MRSSRKAVIHATLLFWTYVRVFMFYSQSDQSGWPNIAHLERSLQFLSSLGSGSAHWQQHMNFIGMIIFQLSQERKWKVSDVVFSGPRNKLVWGEQSINLWSAKQLTRLVFMFNINTSPSATTPPILPESPQLCSSSFVFRPIFALLVITVFASKAHKAISRNMIWRDHNSNSIQICHLRSRIWGPYLKLYSRQIMFYFIHPEFREYISYFRSLESYIARLRWTVRELDSVCS